MTSTPAVEHCANCDRPIGRLETPRMWNDQIVCEDCHARLSHRSVVSAGKSDEDDVAACIYAELGAGAPLREKPQLDYQTRRRKEAERARMMGAKFKAPASAAKHEGIGATVAIIGGILFTIGFKNFGGADAERYGINPGWAVPVMAIGLIAFCVGAIWFSVGRIMRPR